jgi:hypothetical protein
MQRLTTAALVAWLVLQPARALWAQDTVYYVDTESKKETSVKGTIEQESPAGIRIKARTEVKDIPSLDVVQVVYSHKSVTAPDFREPFTKESRAMSDRTRPADRAELLRTALAGYQELEAKVRDAPPIRRYLLWKIAQVTALQGRDDPARQQAAIDLLIAYKNENATGWEIVPALKLLARLQEDKGDFQGASQSYADLAELPGLPDAMKREAQLLGVRLLLRVNEYAKAVEKLKGMQSSLSNNDPQRALVDVYLAQAQIGQGNVNGVETQLQKVIHTTSLENVRGLAHNTLGDYYRIKNQSEPAFWQYLMVDTLYNQDKDEHAKALYYLSQLHDKVKNDKVRAEECLTKLKTPLYAGTPYQRMVENDKKSP